MRGLEEHESLIDKTIEILRREGYSRFEKGKKVPMGWRNYYVDILAYKDGEPIPIECGSVTDQTRIPHLLRIFEKVIHVGFSGRITVLSKDMGVWYFQSYRYGNRENTTIACKKVNASFKDEVVKW